MRDPRLLQSAQGQSGTLLPIATKHPRHWTKEPMYVVQPGHDDVLVSTREDSRFVQEHVETEPLESLSHMSWVMITENGQTAIFDADSFDKFRERANRGCDRRPVMPVNVASQSLEVHLDADEEAGSNSGELRQTIQMSVAEVEDAIAIEGLWEVRKRYGAGHQPDIERIAPPAPIQTEQSSTGVKRGQACRENPVPPQRSRAIRAQIVAFGFP